jgi:diguanylate cyclase (GGDEF)-like protein
MRAILTMASNDPVFAEEEGGRVQDDLRQQISRLLLEQLDAVTADTVAIFPYSGAEPLDAEFCNHVGRLLVRLLAFSVRDGRLDPRGGFVSDLHQRLVQRNLSMERLFTFAYLTERTALDELAVDETMGATTEPWPLVAQLVRRASFDLLAAYTERVQLEPSETAVIDRLTTLYTRPMFDAVLAKELERAGRFGYQLSLILFDVDRMSQINEEHGYGVGDKILERLGITLRTYFRQHDWVARHSEDSIVVLLTLTEPDNAAELAERVRKTIEERLELKDHRDGRTLRVTLSAAVINAQVAVGDMIDPERLMADAEAVVDLAKQHGRNRVERVDGYTGLPPDPAPSV